MPMVTVLGALEAGADNPAPPGDGCTAQATLSQTVANAARIARSREGVFISVGPELLPLNLPICQKFLGAPPLLQRAPLGQCSHFPQPQVAVQHERSV